jgi:hypothetical protein
MTQKTKPEIKFDPVVWANWEQRFLEEEEEAYRNAPAEEPAIETPKHELMDPKEVCSTLIISMSTLKRYTKARKLAYIKRDGRLWFRREDIKRFDQKRYIPER